MTHLTTLMLLALAGVGGAQPTRIETAKFRLDSPAFTPGGEIPRKHTCEGADVSPALSWSQAPAGTKSIALIVDDPDAPDPAAPKLVWVHWVVYNLPPEVTSLAEGVKAGALPGGALDGLNDWKQTGWRGPCPPVGRHRYFFRLYALDTKLAGLHRPSNAQVLAAMKGHVLATAERMGTYQKQR